MFVFRSLHNADRRYRLHTVELPGKPNLMFSEYIVAMFIQGFFRHQH
jgi:DNA mismatch endonuclease, patch repair protein